MKAAGILMALGLALAACGDDGSSTPDAPLTPDASPDAPGVDPTLTSYVIDLVTNHTADNTEPRGFAEFQALPDPDGDMNTTTAYAALF